MRDCDGMFIKGHNVPNVWRDKISNSNRGKIAHNRGVPCSKKTKEKLSKALGWKNHPMYGKHHSEETKKKIGLANKGRFLTEEHKEKLSIAHKGKKCQFRRVGIKHSKETRRKMSLAKKGKIPKNMELMREKRKELIDKGMGKVWSKNNTFTDYAKQRFKEVRKTLIFPKKDTTIEVKVQKFLKQLGIEFFTHQYIEIEHGYQCDVLIPSMNLVIECDGDYWHKYPIGREIDKVRTSELIKDGFKVLRLWEHEIRVITLEEFNNKLEILV